MEKCCGEVNSLGEVLWRCVVENCFREVLWRSAVEKCCGAVW